MQVLVFGTLRLPAQFESEHPQELQVRFGGFFASTCFRVFLVGIAGLTAGTLILDSPSLQHNVLTLFDTYTTLACTSFANPCAAQAAEEETIFFETKIRPVQVEHCYECHVNDPDNIANDLRLTTAQGIRKGGKSG